MYLILDIYCQRLVILFRTILDLYNLKWKKDMINISDLNYIVSTPDRRKNTQICHINMLKSYINRDKNNVVQCANIVSLVPENCKIVCDTQNSRDFEIKFLVFCVFRIRTFFVTWIQSLNTWKILKDKNSKNLYINKNIYFLMCQQEQTQSFMMWM